MGIAHERHIPLVLRVLVAIFLVAPMAIIVPMSFSTAISFEFPPPGYWTGYYVAVFLQSRMARRHRQQLRHRVRLDDVHAAVALPAAFGFVRYRFYGKSALNLLMMLPIIVPAVVSALGYYGFLSLPHLVGHTHRHDHRAQRAVDPDRVPRDLRRRSRASIAISSARR